MKLITQGKVNVGYLFIVAIIAVIAGGIMFGATRMTKCSFWWPSSSQIQSVKDETLNWETYTNQIHKFEIKYPKEWTLQKEVGVPPETIIGYRWEDNGYCSLNMLIVSDDTDNSLEMDWYRQNGYKEKSYTIGGMAGIKFSKFPTENSAPVGVIYFDNNSDRIDMVASEDNYESCIPIFNQMLSTFKFIESVSIWPDVNSFDINNKTFEGKISFKDQRIKVLITDSTKIYQTISDAENIPNWENKYYSFNEFYSLIKNWSGPEWRFTVNGKIENNEIMADEIFYYIQ